MTTTVNPNLLHGGSEAARPPRIPLQAGPWSMDFQDGDLRRISLDRTEVVQRLCVLVRGKNWETLPRTIASLHVEIKQHSFLLACECQSHLDGVDFRWTLRAEGSEQGAIRYAFDGAAFSTFWASRIGICVLQPASGFCGKTLSVKADDGAIRQLVLPHEIAPWPLFTDAREVSYQLDEFPTIRLALFGDLFEAEDQRNWGDASFKIYSRPLRLSYPYRVPEGSRVGQSACLTVAGHVRRHSPMPESKVFRISGLRGYRLPKSGVGFSALPEPVSGLPPWLRALRPDFLSVGYDCADPCREDRLAAGGALAMALEIPLEIRVTCGTGSWLTDRKLIGQALHGAAVCRWLIDADIKFDSVSPTLSGRAPMYWGSSKGFVEINRNRSIARQGDGVWFTLDPQVHASDNDSLVVGLPAQASLAAEARRLALGSPLAVSCVSLRSHGAQGFLADALPALLFEAAWTLGSFKHLAEGEADSVAYFADAGLSGFISCEAGHVAVHPAYLVLTDLMEFRGGEALFTRSSHPLRVEGIALRSGERVRVMLANFNHEEQLVSVQSDTAWRWTHRRCLDASNCLDAMKEPVRWRALPPTPLLSASGDIDVVVPPLGIVTLDGRVPETMR